MLPPHAGYIDERRDLALAATYWSLRIKCNELLWAAKLLDVDAENGVDMKTLAGVDCRPADGFPERACDQTEVY